MDYGVITFSSTYGAIYAQKVLKEVAPIQVMPVLREISLGCGIAVRFKPEDLERVAAALAASISARVQNPGSSSPAASTEYTHLRLAHSSSANAHSAPSTLLRVKSLTSSVNITH